MLIKCPECSGQMSEHATSCPQCGIPSYKIKKLIENQINAHKKEQEDLKEKKRIQDELLKLEEGFSCAVCYTRIKRIFSKCPICNFSIQKSYLVAKNLAQRKPIPTGLNIGLPSPNECPKCNEPRWGFHECKNCDPAPEGWEHLWYRWKWEAPGREKQALETEKRAVVEINLRKEEITRNRFRFSLGCLTLIVIWVILVNVL